MGARSRLRNRIRRIPDSRFREGMNDGQRFLVIEPREPTGRVVLCTHGAGGDANFVRRAPAYALTRALLKSGFTVAASDGGGPFHWGSEDGVRAYERLATDLSADELYLFGQSAGALDAIQLIDSLKPHAVALIAPVTDIRSITKPNLAERIRGRWETPPQHLAPVSAEHVEGLPVMIWASAEDQSVPKRSNADQLARSLADAGAAVESIEVNGDHGSAAHYEPRGIVGFYDGAHQVIAS